MTFEAIIGGAVSIVTFLSGGVGLVKDFLDFRKAALTKATPSRVLIENFPGSLSRSGRAELEQLYVALESIRPVADACLKRLARRTVGFLAGASLLAGLLAAVGAFYLRDMFSLLTASFVAFILGICFYLWRRRTFVEATGYLIRATRELRSLPAIRRASQSAGNLLASYADGLSDPERQLLAEYVKASTAIRSLEAYVLRLSLERSSGALFENLRSSISRVLTDAILEACRSGRIRPTEPSDSETLDVAAARTRRSVEAVFQENGFGDLLETVSPSFFRTDFSLLAREGRMEVEKALRAHIASVA